MKAATAIRKFLGSPGLDTGHVYDTPKMSEIVEMKNACKDGEWQAMGKDACELLNEEFEPA